MNQSEIINAKLYRDIKSGKKYDKYMPYSDCSSIKLAEGDTKQAIKSMAGWAFKYQHHTKEIAKVFKNKNLKTVCEDLHTFLYNNFQYKIDGYNQNLRSPACSWGSRKLGIDCKSYSIFASSVLLNLGINHYLRRITQAPNEGYSHVYVIVPENQKKPTDKKAYFTIDGTVPFKREPGYYKKDDVFMEAKLPIYGLAGVNGGLGALPMVTAALDSGLSNLVNIAFQGLMNELFGCSDAKYEFPVVKMRIETELQAPVLGLIKDLDQAIYLGLRSRIEYLFNYLFKEFDLGLIHLRHEAAYYQRDNCVAETLSICVKYIAKIKEYFDSYYRNFLQNFKLFEINEYTKDSLTDDRELFFVVEVADNPVKASYRYIVLRESPREYPVNPVFPFKEKQSYWLNKNIFYLKNTYNDGRFKKYEKEVKPILNEVVKLRNKYYLGGEVLYHFEQPLSRKMQDLWLKYDDNYVRHLNENLRSLAKVNQMINQEYKIRLKQEIEADEDEKSKKKMKKYLGIASVSILGMLVLNKIING